MLVATPTFILLSQLLCLCSSTVMALQFILFSLFPTKCTDWKTGSILIGSRRRGRCEKSPSDAEGWIRADNGIEWLLFVEGDHSQPCCHRLGPPSCPSSVVRSWQGKKEEAAGKWGALSILEARWVPNLSHLFNLSSCFAIEHICETQRVSYVTHRISYVDGYSAINGYLASLCIFFLRLLHCTILLGLRRVVIAAIFCRFCFCFGFLGVAALEW